MKYGVKLTVIDSLDYNDMEKIANAIRNLGYKILVVDNGNFLCEKNNLQNNNEDKSDIGLNKQAHSGSGDSISTKYVSQCCGANVKKDSSDDGTFTFVCQKCKKDCDITSPEFYRMSIKTEEKE